MKLALSAAAAPRTLVRSARLLAAIGGLAMASTGECSPVVLCLFLAFFLIGLRVDAMPALQKFLGAAQPYFAVVVFALALADFFTVSQSFLLAVANFLLGIQALRLTALRTNRENLGSALISSLMVLSAATLAVDWTFFVLLALFLPAVVWTLMLHTIALESDLATAGQSVVAMDRSRNMDASSPVWRRMAPVLRRAAAAAFAISALCCAFVFMTFPRFNFQGFRGQFLQPLHKTGFTSQVDLEKSGRIFEDNSIVMRVEVAEADRPRWTGYLRGSVLDQFDGRTWRRASRPADRVYPSGLGEFRLRTPGRGPWIRQSIYLESLDTPVLFAAPHAFFVRIERSFLEVSADGTVQRRQSDAWRIHYDVTSAVTAGAEPFLGGKTAPSRQTRVAETIVASEVPIEGTERLGALAIRAGGNGSPVQIAERLANYLRDNYTYSLEPAPADASSPVERFLFTTKRGHCEYFASALTLMLRHRGIPARIVTGFLSTEWNQKGDYYIVRMKHAHAWVEYHVPGRGWVEIDPSPRNDGGSALRGLSRQVQEAWDFMNLRWNRYILSYDLEKQVALIRAVSFKSGKMSLNLEKFAARLGRIFSIDAFNRGPMKSRVQGVHVPLAPFLVAGLFAVVFFAYRMLRERRSGRVWFHRPFVQLLLRAGAQAAPGRTLRELLGQAEPRLGEGAEAARRLTDAYYRLRFAPAQRPSRGERRELDRALSTLRRDLASQRKKH